VEGEDLRVATPHLDPLIAAALASPRLGAVKDDQPTADTLEVQGERWLITYRMLSGKREWVIGIAIPEEVYTHNLSSLRDRFFTIFGITSVLAFLAGIFVLRQLRRGLGTIVAQTARMRAFDFESTALTHSFADICEVHHELERAKTSMRSLCKYVPLILVRDLYLANREPGLGGELRELSILFCDIQGFTSLAEKLSPDLLATALGHYLKEMTEALQSHGGTVDKFIGDAVMAFWNAPHKTNQHTLQACRAIQECKQRLKQLYASSAWDDLAPLVTRFGLHVGTVMVGHFGAPDRFSYTALGDGVNLASRLEELCKQYGIETLVSEDVVKAAGHEFMFRLIDKVIVKGRNSGVKVYQLLGTAQDVSESSQSFRQAVAAYEEALDAYFHRKFARALEILTPYQYDAPSATLTRRCRGFIIDPPPENWDGVYVAPSK
jgi:adenylate cyclase